MSVGRYNCGKCGAAWFAYEFCPYCKGQDEDREYCCDISGAPLPHRCWKCVQVPSAAANSEEEKSMSMIDERQIEVLDAFRDARDVAKRHAQSKVDRATLMKIQAEALIAESKELVAELNEDTPIPGESGSPIGPIPGAGGGIR